MAKVRLSSGRSVTAYIPGIGTCVNFFFQTLGEGKERRGTLSFGFLGERGEGRVREGGGRFVDVGMGSARNREEDVEDERKGRIQEC